jgi:hypothetical protein
MKKFTIEVKGASAGQLQTIAAELKIMSNAWAKFGPRIWINGKPLEALSCARSQAPRAISVMHSRAVITSAMFSKHCSAVWPVWTIRDGLKL